MKHYKHRQIQKEERTRKPNAFDRKQILIKATRKVALETPLNREYGVPFNWDRFGMCFLSHIDRSKIIITYDDVNGMYYLYKDYIKILQEKKRKAEFLGQHYIPIPEDLFTL